jgi:hypothetical protein
VIGTLPDDVIMFEVLGTSSGTGLPPHERSAAESKRIIVVPIHGDELADGT